LVESPQLFIVYGIAGILAGFAHAPVAALVLALELTQRFDLIPFLVIIVFTSSVIVRSITKESLYQKSKVG
jgi:H+/Cl- antiporter ClcA